MTVDPAVIGILNHPGVIDYFSRNAHRMASFRALLELLSIPLPDWATRDISGRAANRRNVIAAFREEHPETLRQRTMRLQGERTGMKASDTAAELFG